MVRPSSKRKKKKRAQGDRTGRALYGAAWTFTGLALLGALERYLWLGALVRELAFHLALLALLAAAFAMARRAWLPLASLTALAALFAVPLAPLYRPTRPTPEAGPLLRVATAHLSGNELNPSDLARWLTAERPQALALTGLRQTRTFDDQIGNYRIARSRTDLRTLLLVQSALLSAPQSPSDEPAYATVRVGRCALRVLAVELPALAAYTAHDARKRMIARLRALPRTPRSVWLGQLGSVPDAHDLSALLEKHELRDGRHGHGRFATAPASLGSLGVPLSHVLVHGWLRVRELTAGAPIAPGAQRSLQANVELTEPRCRPARARGTE